MRRSVLVIATGVLWACSSFGAAPTIGVTDDHTQIPDGTLVSTAGTPSDIHLQAGVDLRLSARSTGTLYSDHLVLDGGAVRVGNFAGYTVDASQLRIQADDSAALAVIRMTTQTIEVASLGGALNVTDGGVMLTRVVAGTRVSFQQSTPQKNRPLPDPDRLPTGEKVFLWGIGVAAVAALVIGLTAAAQGKSPF